jgi:hypothetical protein
MVKRFNVDPIWTDIGETPWSACVRSADAVVPVGTLHASEKELKRLGVDVTSHVLSGLRHSVSTAGIRLGGKFVVKGFGLPTQGAWLRTLLHAKVHYLPRCSRR